MSKELPTVITETMPGAPGGFLDALRAKWLARTGAVLGGLAITAGAPAAMKDKHALGESFAAPVERVGFSTNNTWVTSLEVAEENARQAATDGANNLRILEPFTQGGSDVKNDADRICNTAQAASDNNLGLSITMEGYYKSGGRGFVPTRGGEMRQYTDTVNELLATIHNCAPDINSLEIGDLNEPDNQIFNKNPAMAPQNLAKLMAYSYSELHEKAEELGIDLTLVAGDLSSGINSKPESFINALGEYIKSSEIPGRLADKFAIHIYPNYSDPNPNQTVANKITGVQKALKKNFHYSLPLELDEVGAITEVSDPQEHGYIRRPQQATITPLSEAQQAEFYTSLIKFAACQGIEGLNIFYDIDNRRDTLRTGIRYANGDPKQSAKVVKRLFYAAKNGGSIACAAPTEPNNQ